MTSYNPTQSEPQRSNAATDSSHPAASDSLATAIAAHVADQTNVAPKQLPPLYEAINPDALATMFEPTAAGKQRSNGHVSFVYCDCRVTVTSQREISVEPIS